MTLVDLYPQIKAAHVTLAAASGTLFALRGAAVLAGRRWPMAPLPRRASAAIDTLLLAAGATLWWLLGLNPLGQPWLGTKLALIAVYIGLGTFALKRAPTRRAKAAFYAAALAVFGFVVTVARAHAPLGMFAP
jgi:uncharacterized membrane protein SirB2